MGNNLTTESKPVDTFKYPSFDDNGLLVSRYFDDVHCYGSVNTKSYLNANHGLIVRLAFCEFKKILRDLNFESFDESLHNCFLETSKKVLEKFQGQSAFVVGDNIYLFFKPPNTEPEYKQNSIAQEPLVTLTRISSYASVVFYDCFINQYPIEVEDVCFRATMFPSVYKSHYQDTDIDCIDWHSDLLEYLIDVSDHPDVLNNKALELTYSFVKRTRIFEVDYEKEKDIIQDTYTHYNLSLIDIQHGLAMNMFYGPYLITTSSNIKKPVNEMCFLQSNAFVVDYKHNESEEHDESAEHDESDKDLKDNEESEYDESDKDLKNNEESKHNKINVEK